MDTDTLTSRELVPDPAPSEEVTESAPCDVAARVKRGVVDQLDAWARKNRWSRSAAIAAAIEMAVSAQPSATGWDNAEVRG